MTDRTPEHGTLVIAGLLLLALAFAGYWIDAYVTPGADIRSAVPWFGFAGAVIVVLGIATYAWRGAGNNGKSGTDA